MKSPEKTVEAIKTLMASGDLSDSLHLRQLHQAALQAFNELNANLDKCRDLINNGDPQGARRFDCSFEPSLTRIAEILEPLKKSDFFVICKEYGLEMPQFPDERLLLVLQTPVSSGEKRLHALLQDYRKIARTGSMQQRIELLRKIVSKLPTSSRWLNDLVSAERSRFQEIEAELGQLTGEKDCQRKLEELYREVMDPEWQTAPKPEMIARIRDMLLPLQKASLDNEVEQKLGSLTDCWVQRDIPRLGEELDQWEMFIANPMITLTPDQQSEVNSIKAFFRDETEKQRNAAHCQSLIRTIEQKLADNAGFPEIAGDYNQLRLQQDYQVPETLLERLRSLEEEHQQYERLRHIRLCIGGTIGTFLLVAFIVVFVLWMQHFLTVKRNYANMNTFWAKKQYDEIIKLYDELKTSSPKVAADARLVMLYKNAEKCKKDMEQLMQIAEQEFCRLLVRIEQLSDQDFLDNSKGLDDALAKGEKLSGKIRQQELLDKFARLNTKVIQRRTNLKKEREKRFAEFCRKELKMLSGMIDGIRTKEKDEMDIDFNMRIRNFSKKIADFPYAADPVKKSVLAEVAKKEKEYKEAWEKEIHFRRTYKPVNFVGFYEGFKSLKYKYPDLAIRHFGKIYRNDALLEKWKREFDNGIDCEKPGSYEMISAVNTAAYKEGFLKSDLEEIMPSATRTAEFARFFSDLQKQKNLKEIIFTTSDNKPFFFYVADEILVERLNRPRRINISFTANAVENEKKRHFIFSLDRKNKETPFVRKSNHEDLPYQVPQAFAMLDGLKEFPAGTRKNYGKFWPVYTLIERYNSLGSDGPGLFFNMQKAIIFILEDPEFSNVYLKETLLIYFLEALCKSSQLYPEIRSALTSLQEYSQKKQHNWRAPQASAEYQEEFTLLEEKLRNTDLKRLLKIGNMRGDFVCALHGRNLKPVGIVQKASDSGVRIHLFHGEDLTRIRELLIYNGKSLEIVPPVVAKGFLPREERWKDLLFTGQVLWSFSDGKTTKEFLAEWRKKALELNTSLNLYFNPSILPVGFSLKGNK